MSTTVSALENARAALPGFGDRLIGPDDPRYEEARTLFNAMIDKRPALIARCETPDDVAAAIRFARDHDLRIAVRGGAHNGAGLASVDDGLVIDLSPLKSIAVDPAAQTVRVGAGSVWGEVDAATQPHNLAVPTGIISSTGVAGLTLGGGHGYLARRHGLTVDNLLSAKLVLADGSQVTASADEHPDLFWAIRGGGGNFGVVTEFTFRAHPLETIVGGPDVLGDRERGRVAHGIPRVASLGPAQRDGLLQLPHDPARGGGLPGGAPPAQGVRHRLVHRRLGRGCGGRDGPAALDRGAPHPRRRAHADRGAERRVRRPLRPRRPVVLARRLRPGDPRRGGRPQPRVERADARLQGRHAPLPDRRRRTGCQSRGHRLGVSRRDLVAGLHRLRPGARQGATRCASGRSATRRRSGRTPRARATSTS